MAVRKASTSEINAIVSRRASAPDLPPGDFSNAITGSGTGYKYVTFTSSGTLTVTQPGVFRILVVGGGAGGGCHHPNGTSGWYTTSGGGGGGQVIDRNIYLPQGSYTITVGAGGASRPTGTGPEAANAAKPGNASGIGTGVNVILATGGSQGEGASSSSTPGANSGGCGEYKYPAVPSFFGTPGLSTTGVGYVGGTPASTGGASGGGGAGANGANGSANTGGNGGAGASSSITGSPVSYGGGGGGGGISAGGSGGAGGGGNGVTTGAVNNGAANTGGGGGGLYRTTTSTGDGSLGGSGIVIVRVDL